ncbi:Helix-turn-helix domain-containing protein [Pustulibacterium marinum]|uniref:Helix-turn-helix domain-containing protein n=1 Tax=Pustulibacterium marinum TaxID=1224947 RepID=A0A1I7FZZ8_9FLAO|nr:helix-turn-helix domain-containing protein [Pustulibacterium marinum]SFU41774.1 Helix-turn-helix domain-containing protein [Pustulibacterium marinum]
MKKKKLAHINEQPEASVYAELVAVLYKLLSEKAYCTEAQAMHKYGVSRNTLYNWRKQHKIPFERIGGTIYYPDLALVDLECIHTIIRNYLK